MFCYAFLEKKKSVCINKLSIPVTASLLENVVFASFYYIVIYVV